jgi:hypothetical protein
VLKIFDSEGRITDWGKIVCGTGSSLRQVIAPPLNATLYLRVSGYGISYGAYSLVLQPLKVFDPHEPNDDVYHATRIAPGATVAAGIMDANDTDFYSFVSPRTGTVSILISSRSNTLIPALSTFAPDMRSTGFGPDLRAPGAPLRHTMEGKEGQLYCSQVWARQNTTGDYSLKIE